MRIPGLSRAETLYARFVGKLNPGPIILYYHKVSQQSTDPHLLSVTPKHFDEQLLALRAHYTVVSLQQLARKISVGVQLGPLVVLTFDDGYADNAITALPLLKKHNLPATFFLTSGFVGTENELLQDELERLLLLSSTPLPEIRITLAGKEYTWHISENEFHPHYDFQWKVTQRKNQTSRHKAYHDICALLRSCSLLQRQLALQQLYGQLGNAGPARPTHRLMTWDEARRLASCSLIEIGAHTVNHCWLSSQSVDEQRREIFDSKKSIEKEIGRPVQSFAFPYGTSTCYTTETLQLLREAGFQVACMAGHKRIALNTNLLQFPRKVVRDLDGDTFLKELYSTWR